MKLGVDCRSLLNNRGFLDGGMGIMTYELILAFQKLVSDRDEIYLFLEKSNRDNSFIKNFRFSKIYLERSCKSLRFWDKHVLHALKMRSFSLDFILFPAHTVPLFYHKKSILLLHDVAIYKYPEYFQGSQFFSKHVVLPYAIKKATQLVTVSRTTQKDVMELFNVNPDKVKLIYGGVPEMNEFNESVPSQTPPYILFMGNLNVRKNLIRMLVAFEELYRAQKIDSRFEFWILGPDGYGASRIKEWVKKSSVCRQIHFLGEIEEHLKNEILKKATLLAYVSLYEGFGLPILEAMGRGVPVLTSNLSSMPEVAGNAAVLVDPFDIHAISKGMEQLINKKDLRYDCVQRGLERVKTFSVDRMAFEFFKLFKGLSRENYF